MKSDELAKLEKDSAPSSFKLFFEKEVLPYLRDVDQVFFKANQDLGLDNEYLREEYERFLQYDPTSDKGDGFESSIITPITVISFAKSSLAFKNAKESFLEKLKLFGEILYRDAFFRNSYDNLEAWQSCHRFKEYQALLENLGVLPDAATDRIFRMSEELDTLWSKPEVERVFNESLADQYVDSGGHQGDMLDRIYRKESEPIAEEKYDSFHELRPDLFPKEYDDYLKKLEEFKHPYVLKL